MNVCRFFVIILLGILSVCCRQRQYSHLLDQAEQLVRTAPSEVIRLTDTLNPATLNRFNQHVFNLLRLHASYEANRDISHYLPPLNSARYFQQRGDDHKAGLAYFYSGVILKAHKNYEQASVFLSEAKEQASSLQDSLLMFHTYYELGDLFYLTHDLDDSEEAYQEALAYHPPADTNNHYEVGDCLLHTGQYTEARKYYKKAENQVLNSRDTVSMSDLLYQISISYLKTQKKEQAAHYAQKALQYDQTPAFQIKCQLHLCDIYLQQQQTDSAVLYLGKIIPDQGETKDLTAAYYRLLSRMSENRGDYRTALEQFRKYDEYTDHFWQEKRGNRMEKAINRYNKQKWLGKNHLLSQQKNILTISTFCLILLLLLFATYAAILLKRKRYKYLEACQMIETLQNFCREKDQCEDKFRTLLSNQLEISKKMAVISQKAQDQHHSFLQTYNELMGDLQQKGLDWEELYFTIDYLYNNFHRKIKEKYPELNEKEIRLCCLLRAGFKTDEIAFVTRQSIYSIHKRKTNIRKKLSMDERADILENLLIHIL